MSNHTSLPLEAHNNRSVFLEHAWNIGRAYRNQALELISICQFLSRIAPPKLAHEDAELRRMLRVCDLALRCAANSDTKVTDEANTKFKEATRVLSSHSERRHRLDLPLTIYSRMEIAKLKDKAQSDWSYVKFEGECGPTKTINFVLLRSPLLAPHDPESVIVSQELSAGSSLPEILLNFSRYKDRARITLEQNPHFYLRFPADESAITPNFQYHPFQGTSGTLEHNDTVYVLLDRPGHVFLEIEDKLRIFGNVWSLNGFLIFKDRFGVLEGEQLVRSSSIRSDLWYCEQPVVHHDSKSHFRLDQSCLRPIVTTLSAGPPSEGTFEDWTVLSHPTSHSIDIYIYGPRRFPGSTRTLDLPPPPTSERPGYRVLYTTINTLNDDILLGIFKQSILYDQWWAEEYNSHLGWCELPHVCQRWRHLVYSSALHLNMLIRCTYGTPIVNTLDHLPLLPLFVGYRDGPATIREQDELGIYHALLLRDRVRSIDLDLPPLVSHKFLMLMDRPFPILEDLRLDGFSTADEITTLTLPKTFLAPNLRSVTLDGISLSKGLPLLSSTVSLVTLTLKEIQTADYLFPRKLVSRLRYLPRLENLTIDFSFDTPRPGAERESLGKQRTPVTLPILKDFVFTGFSAHMECLVAQIRAPLLERLTVTLFSQMTFALPHLAHFTDITKGLKLPAAKISFRSDSVSISTDIHSMPCNKGRFELGVMCEKPLVRQLDRAAQICRAIPALSSAETLRLESSDPKVPNEWATPTASWRRLLRPFVRVKELRICSVLSRGLSYTMEVDEVGSDPGLLPSLQELVSDLFWGDKDALFVWFIRDRRVAGRPIRSSSRFFHSNPPRA